MTFPLMLDDRPMRYIGDPWAYITVPRAFMIMDSDRIPPRPQRKPQHHLPKRLR